MLYPCYVATFHAAPYMYHSGVKTLGEYESNNVLLGRIFCKISEEEAEKYKEWKKVEQDKTTDFFDDHGATLVLHKLVSCDEKVIPLFGYIDAGNVFAASMQSSILNPFLFECGVLITTNRPIRN